MMAESEPNIIKETEPIGPEIINIISMKLNIIIIIFKISEILNITEQHLYDALKTYEEIITHQTPIIFLGQRGPIYSALSCSNTDNTLNYFMITPHETATINKDFESFYKSLNPILRA